MLLQLQTDILQLTSLFLSLLKLTRQINAASYQEIAKCKVLCHEDSPMS